MSQTTEIADMTALEMLRLFASRALSPVEAARACLARIHAHNATVNAYCLIDEETTLGAARAAEERYRRGLPLGDLDGVPVAIKDMFLFKGWPNLKGSKVVDPDQPWEVDAPVTAALRRHGFVPLGKTTSPEYGWKGVTDCALTGVTRNPWDPTKTAGGSSGGSGAAVPLGMGPLALGTDAGGSIRIPAGFCGVVGHKPTHGRVPMWPPSAFWPLAHPGPMTWTVADAALMMDVMTEADLRDATLGTDDIRYLPALTGNIRGLRVAYSPRLGYAAVDPEVAAAVRTAVDTMALLGAEIDEVDPGFADPLDAFEVLFYAGAANAMRDLGPEQRAQMDPGLVEVANWADGLSALDYLAAMNARNALLEHMSRFHQRYDLLITPSLPLAAFEAGREVPADWPHKRWPTWTPFTYPFNLTGQPACSVPCGFTQAGLPIGLQLVGPRHDDLTVLRAAHAYQLASPLTNRRPALLSER